MSNVLFINGPASGHVYPTFGLVKELIAAGEKVVYVSSEDFRHQVEQLGAAFIAYENFLNLEDPFKTNSYLSLVIKILRSYDIVLPCILELSKQYSFDYIIHDSMYGCGNVVADMLNVPNVATCTSFILAERLLTENSRNTEQLKNNMMLVKQFISLSRAIWEKYNIKRRADMNEVFFNEGKLNLVFTSEYFQPQREKLGSHYQFVGPIISNREDPVQFSIDRIRNTKTIYISLGTVFNDDLAFYRLCFDALASFEGTVVLSVGKRIDLNVLGEVPSNFIVVPFVPQLQILPYTDLFITHGGMNSVNEALYFNVPLIVIPMAADQPIVGERVATLGAGQMLNRSNLTPQQLSAAVRFILQESSYNENCRAIGESLRAAGGQQRAIVEIQKFKMDHNIKS
jgi:MGT family glycosyltransferase